jgi:hypothetical protein
VSADRLTDEEQAEVEAERAGEVDRLLEFERHHLAQDVRIRRLLRHPNLARCDLTELAEMLLAHVEARDELRARKGELAAEARE